jgi:hypothetical protein
MLISEQTIRDNFDRGRRSDRRHSRSRGGGSPELGVYGPSDLGFRRGLHLRHGCDLENLLCSPWEDGGQQWRRLRARRLGSSSILWAKFDELGPLYIGLLVPTHRGFGILTNLSPTRFQITADKANLRRG